MDWSLCGVAAKEKVYENIKIPSHSEPEVNCLVNIFKFKSNIFSNLTFSPEGSALSYGGHEQICVKGEF